MFPFSILFLFVLTVYPRYATIIRDSRRLREREFLGKVHECVANGGKVLIPVFALGRSQELCLLIESYWERLSLDVPVYFSAGLTEKANHYYRLYLQWTNQMIKSALNERNIFEFKHIKTFEKHMADQPGPMVLFASPGMLHSGTAAIIFLNFSFTNPKNS